MKKLLSILLIVALCAMLFACTGAKLTAKPSVITEPTEETTTVAPTVDTTEEYIEDDFFEDEFGAESEAAISSAMAILNGEGVSQSGLQTAMEAEGYNIESIMAAIGSLEIDWNAQAAKAAKAAMTSDPVSPDSLKDLLLSDGFNASQADYGVANCGNWNSYALAYARQYYASLDAAEIEAMLITDGFTASQAAYAAAQISK